MKEYIIIKNYIYSWINSLYSNLYINLSKDFVLNVSFNRAVINNSVKESFVEFYEGYYFSVWNFLFSNIF